MGCLKLTYREELPTLKVVKGFSFSLEKSCAGLYRYGFNGMEADDEVRSDRNALEFGGRSIYDGRLGKFISVDPKWKKFPGMSPYTFAGNSPITFIDREGLDPTKPKLFWKKRPMLMVKMYGDLKNAILYETHGIHKGDDYWNLGHKMYVLEQWNDDGDVNYHYLNKNTNKWVAFNPNDIANPKEVERIALGSIYLTATVVAGLQFPLLGKELWNQFKLQSIGNVAIEGLDAYYGDGTFDLDEVLAESIAGVDIFDGGVSVVLRGKGPLINLYGELLKASFDASPNGDVTLDKKGDDIIIDLSASFVSKFLTDGKASGGKFHKMLRKAYKKAYDAAVGEAKDKVKTEAKGTN